MKQTPRTLRTLIALVLAMSATSLLLGYMNPVRVAPSEEQRRRIQQAATAAVEDNVSLVPDRWQGIEVRAAPEPRRGAAMLAAVQNDEAWHFLIGLDGIPVRNPSWTLQRWSMTAPRRILIQLTRPHDSGDFLPQQVIGIRSLVGSIHRFLRPAGDALPVRYAPDA